MTLKEDYTQSRKTLAKVRALTQPGDAEEATEAQERPSGRRLATPGRHPALVLMLLTMLAMLTLLTWLSLAQKEIFQTPDL